MTGKTITHYVYPPIGIRHWNWVAFHDGEDEQTWLHGTGRTETEALEDLRRLDDERAEAPRDHPYYRPRDDR